MEGAEGEERESLADGLQTKDPRTTGPITLVKVPVDAS